MSTRCQIKVSGQDVLVYKHSDGYPDGVLPTLTKLVDEFLSKRGWDSSYLVAHIVHAFIASDWKAYSKEEWFHGSKFLGYGLDTVVHGDIEYFYEVMPNGEILVKVPKPSDDYEIHGFRLIETVPRGGKKGKKTKGQPLHGCEQLEFSGDDDDYTDDSDETPTCPACGGPGTILGTLGRRTHYRCRHCGSDFS